MDCKVTWLIAVKNGLPYLPETLASIAAQTYKNWEVLVWDNGSTDGTLDELQKWIPSRLPGRVVSDRPASVGISRAEMVQYCQTELCAIIDADDLNLPERLEKQVKFLDAHPDIAVVGSQVQFIDERGEPKNETYTVPMQHDDIVHEMLFQNSIAQPTVLFRRAAILEVGNYRFEPSWNGVNIEDYDLWLRVAAANLKLANLPETLVKYRIHSRSTTQQSIRNNLLKNAMDFCAAENAPKLFGCSGDAIAQLRNKKYGFAIKPLFQIAQHLHAKQAQGKQGSTLLARLRSNSFLESCKNLVASKDIGSRLILAGLHPQPKIFLKELWAILVWFLNKLFRIDRFSKNIEEYTWNRRLNKWLKDKTKNGTHIHPTIEFIGDVRPNLDDLHIADKCTIEKEFSLWISQDRNAKSTFKIDKCSFIGRNTYIGVFQPVSIGEFVQIGAYSYIISGNHRYESREIPIIQQGYVGAPIAIEDGVWLGTHVVVLPGVTIGKGAIVAAHSLVNRDIPAYEVWGGVPARFIKHRP
jgi:acetyltransferase-like isoleucine patch superfamily enzyme/GT2 family glycosyltransferase